MIFTFLFSVDVDSLPLYCRMKDFAALCLTMEISFEVQKKAEFVMETFSSEFDQQHDIEVFVKW